MLKFSFLFILSLLLFTQTVVGHWDIAVSTTHEIHFFNANWNEVEIESYNDIRAIAFDEIEEQIFFSDRKDKKGVLFLLKLDPLKTSTPSIELLVPRTEDNWYIGGIAYDPVSRTLFWTEPTNKIINSLSLDGSHNKPKKLKDFSADKIKPFALAIDVCRGKLYYTNKDSSSPSIRRMSLDGSNDEEIIGEMLEHSTSIAVDQLTESIYFTVDHHGTKFSVQNAGLNGENQRVIVEDYNHLPVGITVTVDSIIWVDATQDIMWRVPKSNSTEQQIPTQFKSFSNTCSGIVSRQNLLPKYKSIKACKDSMEKIESNLLNSFTNSTSPVNDENVVERNSSLYCNDNGNYTKLHTCVCNPGYKGSRCTINECQNLCYNNGACTIVHGFATCKCRPGYAGKRCETWACHNYCLNGGSCEIYNGDATCTCKDGFKGTRCEQNSTETCHSPCILPSMVTEAECSDVCGKLIPTTSTTTATEPSNFNGKSQLPECPNTWNKSIIVIVFGVIVTLGLVYLIIVALKHFYKPARPRIRKTFVVRQKNNGTPLTSRPIADEECQITIENCCNMNICDTPCFDPKLLQQNMENKSKSNGNKKRKDDKEVLIPDIN